MKAELHALYIASGLVALLAMPVEADAADAADPVNSILEQQTLTNDWFGYGPDLRDAGVDLRLELSQFYQGLIKGDDNKTWQYGGHLDGRVRLDLSRMGLWDGFSLTALGDWNYGASVNGFNNNAFPVNTALFFPSVDITDDPVMTALYLTQDFGDLVTVSAGKFNNAQEGIRYRPMFGGGGVDTFWNLNPAVTSSGLVPAGTYDIKVNLKTEPVSFSLMLYDPVDSYYKFPFEDPFENGIGVNGGATLKTSFGGLTGYYGISGTYKTSQGTDLSDIVPGGVGDEIGGVVSDKSGGYAVALTMQQYLVQDPDNPARGWGVFGALTRSDANPTLFQLSYLFGIGGSGLFPNRPDDRFGIAFSRFGVSDVLKEELSFFEVQDEYALEAFYNVAVTPWFRVTADVQWVQPAGGSFPDGVFAGVSTYIKF